MEEYLKIGDRLRLGEKAAEYVEDPSLFAEEVTVEGIGFDWGVIRDPYGIVHFVQDEGGVVWNLLQDSELL